jgi:RNA polymerase sigma-70 factor (ECF subfamily)
MPPSHPHDQFRDRILCHLPELRARASRLSRCASEADDLIQQTLEKALRFSAGLDRHSNPRAWLLRTLFNLFVDLRRQRGRLRALAGVVEARLTAPPPYQPCPWEMIGDAELWRTIEHLPAYQREVLRMTAREGRSYREISEALGVPSATVGTRLMRARQRMRALLQAPTATLPGHPDERPRAEDQAEEAEMLALGA